jgi:hypothetical protein
LAKKEISICRKNIQIENPYPIARKDLAAFSVPLEPANTFLLLAILNFVILAPALETLKLVFVYKRRTIKNSVFGYASWSFNQNFP